MRDGKSERVAGAWRGGWRERERERERGREREREREGDSQREGRNRSGCVCVGRGREREGACIVFSCDASLSLTHSLVLTIASLLYALTFSPSIPSPKHTTQPSFSSLKHTTQTDG